MEDKKIYAGFWKRALSSIIDFLIVFTVFIIVVYLVKPSPENDLVLYIFWILNILYFSLMESSKFQGTFGKQVMKIKVIKFNGEINSPISFLRAFSRNICRFFSAIILFIGYFMAGFTKNKQTLHDMIAECLVIDTKYIKNIKYNCDYCKDELNFTIKELIEGKYICEKCGRENVFPPIVKDIQL